MQKRNYIIIISMLVSLIITSLIVFKIKNTTFSTNVNKIQNTNELIEENSVKCTILQEKSENSITEKNNTSENLIIMNNITEEKENQELQNSTKINKEIKLNNEKVIKQKNTQDKGNNDIKSNTSTITDTTHSKTWNANTSYGGEINDKDGATGSYWLQGEEIDLKDIDMSDWTIK